MSSIFASWNCGPALSASTLLLEAGAAATGATGPFASVKPTLRPCVFSSSSFPASTQRRTSGAPSPRRFKPRSDSFALPLSIRFAGGVNGTFSGMERSSGLGVLELENRIEVSCSSNAAGSFGTGGMGDTDIDSNECFFLKLGEVFAVVDDCPLVLAPETVLEETLVREVVEVVRERVLCSEETRDVVDVLRTLPLSTLGAMFSFRLPGKSKKPLVVAIYCQHDKWYSEATDLL